MHFDFILRILALLGDRRFSRWKENSISLQEIELKRLLRQGRNTLFGIDHQFIDIEDYESFKRKVPIRDYEGLRPYFERIIQGEKDVLWPGRPIYLAKTSGTVSGTKLVPLSRDSLHHHLDCARNTLLMYVLKTGKTGFARGRFLLISGSPRLYKTGRVPTGRLSGILNNHIPLYLKKKSFPSLKTNSIADWKEKLDLIVKETAGQDIRLISGIPPWLIMYFEKALQYSDKKTISKVFPGLSLMTYGGVNFQPYKDILETLIGSNIDFIETYNASEGFFAFQDEFPSAGMILVPDSGIFYEFIPFDRFFEPDPPRLDLSGVVTGVNYAMILNTNAGLWGYNIGDIVRFVSVNPCRLVVTGRVNQFTSAFGEHIIGEEAEASIQAASVKTGALVAEFTLAPMFSNQDGKPCHQWFVEFAREPSDLARFSEILHQSMQDKNAYYKDLVSARILHKPMVTRVPENVFRDYMRSVGKLGGQNKIPHLLNDRKIADWISVRI